MTSSMCAVRSCKHEYKRRTEVVKYEVCTTPSSVLTAVRVLSQHRSIFLDCQGMSIGHIDGALSLLSLGTPLEGRDKKHQRIFLIDTLALAGFPDTSVLYSLRDLLSSQATVKIIWDGRMDEIELRHVLGVGIAHSPVIDLQVAEIIGRRKVLGESDYQRKIRLGKRAGLFPLLRSCPALFEGMHVVMTLGKCVEKYLPHTALKKDPNVTSLQSRKEMFRFLERPVPGFILDHSATNIRMLARLFDSFSSRQIVPRGHALRMLMQMSARRVSRNGLTTRVDASSPFRVEGLLLLDSIMAPAEAEMIDCTACGARLPTSSFLRKGQLRREQCRLCVALSLSTGHTRSHPEAKKLAATWRSLT
ncbi:hypothetical protein K488DRAFT_75240 [Vararia minispora EC-137]|uniref:Uncharacterized protein n=1 Tax=Vararia minispora EC-137 TaxID=1314806 RepID=A0ACB8Q4H8_9AGAM|nr:hypothetical protein K488DRAFT_75240 [Vararia minispora EC-137]